MPPLSVEDGSPVRAPLGIPINTGIAKNCLFKGSPSGTFTNTCQSISQLLDTYSLMTRLEKCEMGRFKISPDSAYLLNNALDVYLRKLTKSSLGLVVSKSVDKFSGPIHPGLKGLLVGRHMHSDSDFRAAVELSLTILGEDWPLHL
ncbi:hypothetical protein E2542_SST06937 [Spatholobus suberectus]|nr:hypothetical protein E2542_SST06937 [Spatholobus suberectus]